MGRKVLGRPTLLAAVAVLFLAACPDERPSPSGRKESLAATPVVPSPAAWALLFEISIGDAPAPAGLVVALLDSPVFGTCDADSWLRAPKADTDGAGRAGFRQVEPGHYYARVDTPLHGVRVVEVDVPANDVFRLEIPDTPVLEGRVLDENGAPLVGATVEAIHGSALGEGAAVEDFDPTRSALTDRNGGFRFGGLRDGDWELTARRADRVTSAALRTPAGKTGLELALPPAVRLTGRVVDDRGEAVSGIWVAARRPGKGEFHFDRFRSGDEGAFEVFVPDSGVWELAARRDHLVSDAKAASPGKPVTLKLPPGATVRGRVLDPDGKPLTGFTIRGRPVHYLFEREAGDAEGRFELRYVRPEVETLIISSDEYGEEEIDLDHQPGRVTRLPDIRFDDSLMEDGDTAEGDGDLYDLP